MAKLNTVVRKPKIYTHEGAQAVRVNREEQLRRVVMASMLWEDQFYVDGQSNAEVIAQTLPFVAPETVAQIAIEAREQQKLRHVPLLLVRELARRKNLPDGLVSKTLARVIQRADEIAEFLAIYWKDGRQPLSAQVKKGLAKAFLKFDAYQLAKYDREGAVRLRDALFLVHAKPKAEEQAATWKALVEKSLASPDTWEVAISAAKPEEKTAEWTRLLIEGKLGALALLRNLRNMQQAKVDEGAIRAGLSNMKAERVLPFRFVAAAKAAPRLEDAIEQAMLRCVSQIEKLPGKTLLIVDTSGSMYGGGNVSKRSDMTRVDAAAALAILIREVCERPVVYCTAGNDWSRSHATALIPNRRGFALSSLITSGELRNKIGGGGIFLTQVMQYVQAQESTADRIIVITDEQDCDTDPARSPSKAKPFGTHNYLINVAAYQNGIGYGNGWHHINGWSEAVIDYIRAVERTGN